MKTQTGTQNFDYVEKIDEGYWDKEGEKILCVRLNKPISPNTHDSKKVTPPKSYLRDV